MNYLITGHTGFKGSWLAVMLAMKGHSVSGISLDPKERSLFVDANLGSIFKHDIRLDIRNRTAIKLALEKIKPDVIVHFAAQPLVRESYKTPIETFETNVLGTLNVLEATRNLTNLKAGLIVTTDKVYKNYGKVNGYVETDELGGDDPYSASKAAADIATQSWVKSFAVTPIAIARAGNVIGGGDWADDRVIPDLVRAYSMGEIPTLRYPEAIRPWQHVLDCLNGYLLLIEWQIQFESAGCWNFGPNNIEKYAVKDLVTIFAAEWGGIPTPAFRVANNTSVLESNYLSLDSTKSRKELAWGEKLDFHQSVKFTVDFYKKIRKLSAIEVMRSQITEYFSLDSRKERII